MPGAGIDRPAAEGRWRAIGVTELLSPRALARRAVPRAIRRGRPCAVDLGIRRRGSAPIRAGGSPATVVAALSARKAARSGVLWGYIFGIAIASSEISYVKLYKTAAQRDALAATYGSNKATSALFGPAHQLQTVGGFTVFKISMTLMILGAVWGLLTSTRLLRGEEDSGRWDLLLTGRTTRRGATAQAIAGLGAGAVALWVVSAIITVLSGQASSVRISVGPSLYLALAMVTTAVMFLAVGAVASQLAATRRQAASFGAAVLGVSYAVRLIADAGVGSPRADLGLPARLGGGAPTSHLTPTPGPLADRRLHRSAGARRGAPRRQPRRR